jgi:hypothetical protein
MVVPIYKLAKTRPHCARLVLDEVRDRSIPTAGVSHRIQHPNIYRRVLSDLVDLESDHVRESSRLPIPCAFSHRKASRLQKRIDAGCYACPHGS